MDKNEIRVALVLQQLNESDKYGVELIDNINKLTENSLDFKPAQLYSMMKTLSSAGKVHSYWQDSDIGGKRHYYKITEIGKKSLANYPKEEEILKELFVDKYSNLQKVDFDTDAIEEKTAYDVNLQNVRLSNETYTTSATEQTFINEGKENKINILLNKSIFDNANTNDTIEDIEYINKNVKDVVRKDYKDYSTDANVIKCKKLYDNITTKTFLAFALQMLIIFTSLLLTKNMSHKAVLNTTFVCGVVYAFAYIFTYISQFRLIRYKLFEGKFSFNFKKNVVINLLITGISFAVLLFAVLILNVTKIYVIDYLQLVPMALICLLPTLNALLNLAFLKNRMN